MSRLERVTLIVAMVVLVAVVLFIVFDMVRTIADFTSRLG